MRTIAEVDRVAVESSARKCCSLVGVVGRARGELGRAVRRYRWARRVAAARGWAEHWCRRIHAREDAREFRRRAILARQRVASLKLEIRALSDLCDGARSELGGTLRGEIPANSEGDR